MSNDAVVVLSTLVAFALIAVLVVGYIRRSDAFLERWAQENGYQIQSKEHRYLRRGPFLWGTSRNQAVFYVEVLDAAANLRRGWVRVGTWWWGVLRYRAEVRWDVDPNDPTAALH